MEALTLFENDGENVFLDVFEHRLIAEKQAGPYNQLVPRVSKVSAGTIR